MGVPCAAEVSLFLIVDIDLPDGPRVPRLGFLNRHPRLVSTWDEETAPEALLEELTWGFGARQYGIAARYFLGSLRSGVFTCEIEQTGA